MKSRAGFTLTILLIFIFSIGVAAASDNATQDVMDANEEAEIALDIPETHDEPIADEEIVEDDDAEDVDVSVNAKVKNEDSNHPTIVVGVKNNGSTAKDTVVRVLITSSLKYISHTEDIGQYSHDTGKWVIGNLTSSLTYNLTILVKNTGRGGYFGIYASTSSNDIDPTNNYLTIRINPYNTTEDDSGSSSGSHHRHDFDDYPDDVEDDVYGKIMPKKHNPRKSLPHSYYEKRAYSEYRVVVNQSKNAEKENPTIVNGTNATKENATNRTNNTATGGNPIDGIISNPVILLFVCIIAIICVRAKTR